MRLRSTAAGAMLAAVLLSTGSGAAMASITNAQLFRWAQLTWPALFPGTPQSFTVSYQGKTFDVRAYANGNHLGVADGRAYGLGSFTGGALQDFGDMQAFAAQVCAAVGCSANDPQGGSVNECMMPASQALVPGLRLLTTHVGTGGPGGAVGETVADLLVDGPATFNGQSVVKSTARVQSLMNGTVTMSQENRYYQQASDSGLVRHLVQEIDSTMAGQTTSMRITYQPWWEQLEFKLGVGQSITYDTTGTTLWLSPTSPTTTGTATHRHVYEARETITVRGRTYDTCRYRETVDGDARTFYRWFIVGKGVPAKTDHRLNGVSVGGSELKSGSINGVPL